MFRRVINKMIHTRRMMLCLLLGIILAVGVLSNIPVYSRGVLQRMLMKDFEKYEEEHNEYPGKYILDSDIAEGNKEDALKIFKYYEENFYEVVKEGTGLPMIAHSTAVADEKVGAKGITASGDLEEGFITVVQAMSDLEKHVKILYGRLPSGEVKDRTYEVMVSEKMLNSKNIVLNKVYEVQNSELENKVPTIRMKIVGVFTLKSLKDPYWYSEKWMEEGFFLNYDLFMKGYLKEEGTNITQAQWYAQLDYRKIKLKNINSIMNSTEAIYSEVNSGISLTGSVPMYNILTNYESRAAKLNITMAVLEIPIMLIIIFYFFMMSQLIVEGDKNEIAVLKSRGAGTWQIMSAYILQAFILGGIGLIAGPAAGLGIGELIGNSNGFLEFVNRARVPMSLNLEAYLYSLAGVAVFIIAMLIPVYFAARNTIIGHKTGRVRKNGKPLWKKLYLDGILLFISLYGLKNYNSLSRTIKLTGAVSSDVKVDPFLFFLSTLFILALGMIYLRFFKYIISFIFRLRREKWSAVTYSALISVMRSSGFNGFVMIFLVLTVAAGIFSANTARTLNSSMEEKIQYKNGADIAVRVKWEEGEARRTEKEELQYQYDKKHLDKEKFEKNVAEGKYTTKVYVEPPFGKFAGLNGVDTATKVLIKPEAKIIAGSSTSGENVYVMGIIPYEFGEVAHLRKGPLPYYFNEYLNIMTQEPKAIIVSTSVRKKYNAKIGDTISFQWEGGAVVEGTIFAFVDYWPTYNPYSSVPGKEGPDLIVASLQNITEVTQLEPYEVWIRQSDRSNADEIYKEIEKTNMDIKSFKSTRMEIVNSRRDPFLQSINGTLTVGFIATLVITTIGLIMYLAISMKERTLQFGVIRAMGMTSREVIRMLFCEQIFVSVLSILYGTASGVIASKLFIPMLSLMYDVREQLPPFKVTSVMSDYFKIYAFASALFILGAIMIRRLMAVIKVDAALKLGED